MIFEQYERTKIFEALERTHGTDTRMFLRVKVANQGRILRLTNHVYFDIAEFYNVQYPKTILMSEKEYAVFLLKWDVLSNTEEQYVSR